MYNQFWHKRGYHMHSDVVFGWVAWNWLSIFDFFAEYLDFFHDVWYNWKMTRGYTAGPEGRSGGRREERSDERRPERSPSGPTGSPHVIFQIWTSITKNIMLLSKKMWDTQPNPRYSAKNNDAIRMISSFMPNYSFILNKKSKNVPGRIQYSL